MRKQVKPKEPPCTERYARWCERTVGKIITYLLLDAKTKILRFYPVFTFCDWIFYFVSMRYALLLPLLFAAFYLQGCTCCVYYNHMFNAERAWEEGNTLQKNRKDSLPADTTWIVNAERAKFDRVIEKCSRTLERFPDDVDSKPRAVFLIAESFRKKGEWSKAVIKYDEFERYFSKHDSMVAVDFQRAFCLYKNGDHAVSRFALDRVLSKGETHPYYPQALHLLSLLEEQALMPELAIAALEKILSGNTGTPFLRGKMHIRVADLYYTQKNWLKAYSHFRAKEVDTLDVPDRIHAGRTGAECLVELQRYSDAAREISGYVKNKDYESIAMDLRERYGEVLLLDQKHAEGLNVLLDVARKNSKTHAGTRAWYAMGDFEQMIRKDYSMAMRHYDSAWASWATSEWGRKSKIRRDALAKLVQLRSLGTAEKPRTPTQKEKFQIAELFMFQLSELDSAILILDSLIDGNSGPRLQDSTLIQRAAYARAFLFEEFKKDSLKADSLYRDLVTRFPGSKVAQQAQLNLGERVTVQTKEDLAHLTYIQAESLWISMDSIPMDSVAQMDSLFIQVIQKYQKIATDYAGTQTSIQALYAVGWLLENQGGLLDSSRQYYEQLRTKYGNTEWGLAALNKLQPRLRITDQELSRLRRRLEQNQETNERLRKQYEEEQQRRLNAKPSTETQEDPTLDEVLESDYNSLYDFQ